MFPGCFSCSPLSLRQIKHDSWLKSLQASRWAGGPKVQARGLISKSRRPGRVQSTPLSHTILEMTKFVCPVVPAELISLFGKSKTNWFQIEHKDCFCCKPTTVSRRKFPEISEILQRAVMLYNGRLRRVCEISGPPRSSYSPLSPRTQLTLTCSVPFDWLCGLVDSHLNWILLPLLGVLLKFLCGIPSRSQ